jgi:hypothetical protein
MANPRRPRPHGYHLVEDCRREKIMPLVRDAWQWRGRVHHGIIFDSVPYAIFLSLAPDLTGSWIRIGNMQLALSFDLFKRWRNSRGWMKPNPNFGGKMWAVDGVKAYARGLDNKRYTYLVMTPTNLIGTVGDIDAQYFDKTLSRKQRRARRRRRLIKPILPWVDEAWLADHDAWWPSRRDKPKWQKFVSWWRTVGELRHGHRYGRGEYIPDPEPKVIHRRRRRPKEPPHPPMDLGHADLADIDRIFRGNRTSEGK